MAIQLLFFLGGDIASRNCSIYLVQFPSSFFSVRWISDHVMHPYCRIDTTAAWKNCVLFYWISLTSIWSITNRQQSMLLLVSQWCHFQKMRRCLWSRRTCQLVSENHYFVWRCLLFDLNTRTLFVCIHMEVNATCCLLQTMQQEFGLSRCICQKYSVICVVSIRNSLCREWFAFWLSLKQIYIYIYIYIYTYVYI